MYLLLFIVWDKIMNCKLYLQYKDAVTSNIRSYFKRLRNIYFYDSQGKRAIYSIECYNDIQYNGYLLIFYRF